MLKSQFFSDALSENGSSLAIRAEAMIRVEADGQAVVPCGKLDVEEYARLNYCILQPADDPPAGRYLYWGGEDQDQLFTKYEQVVWVADWQETLIRIVHLEWETGCGHQSRDWVVADSIGVAEQFILDVERKTHAPGDAVLVFSNGRWSRNHRLFDATQCASFDDLILADQMKDSIRGDFTRFLESEGPLKSLYC